MTDKGEPARGSGRFVLAALGVALVALFLALGTWQVQRRAWKLDLIAKVEARQRAAPIPASRSAGADDIYTRVYATGRFLHERTVLTQAVTVHGPGFWVVTPLQTSNFILLVNRGFVPSRTGFSRPTGIVRITGLIRMSEPKGGFLRNNDPVADRWYSRDVDAIAAAKGLGAVAPYFIDASGPAAPGGPIPGLTQTTFPNSHLSYALTWYTLALMSVVGTVIAIRRGRR